MGGASAADRSAAATVQLRRAYDPPRPDDGHRVLVDRLWPRGVRRDALRLDEWCREVAPSSELRTWFGHDLTRWADFQARYRGELEHNDHVGRLARVARGGQLTLVHAAADTHHNHALVLRDVLLDTTEAIP
ncbi:MAG TPA: DUF488 family protein [Ilumatobacter sp.]|nr:DUF488 family protein [Ilumatobacter sp.]